MGRNKIRFLIIATWYEAVVNPFLFIVGKNYRIEVHEINYEEL